MNLSLPLTLADRIMATLNGLHAAVAARSRLSVLVGRGTEVLATWLIQLICHRIRRTQGRILLMLARFQAGQLVAGPSAARAGRVTRAPRTQRRLSGAEKLPRRLAWLLPLVPCDAANYACQLRLWLAEPEMVALLRASPQARLVLAPLCRMLGIEASVLAPEAILDGLGSPASPKRDAGYDGSVPERVSPPWPPPAPLPPPAIPPRPT